jgi:hypothetical protein
MKGMRFWRFAVLLCAGLACGASAGDLAIASFNGAGRLTFEALNNGTNYTYRVEWASSPAGPWTNFAGAAAVLDAVEAPGGKTVTCSVPMCYRVVASVLAAAPAATTDSATSLAGTSATLNGTGTPGGTAAGGWFRYSTVSPGTGNDTFGTRVPTSGATALGSGTSPVAYSRGIAGLSAGTAYYYCAIVSNSMGVAFGTVQSFTAPLPPAATTTAATSLAGTSATLNGTCNPGGAATTGWFRYSTVHPGAANDSFGTRAPASSGSALGAGSSPVPYSQGISGLIAGTTYYYCAIAENAEGLSFGSILSLTTSATAPAATTDSATSLAGTSATLNGTGTPGGASTTGWFRYSTVSPGTGNDTFGTRVPTSGATALGSGTSPVAYSRGIAGLSAGTAYYYCAIVSNSMGVAFGTVQSFTAPLPPAATTTAATSLAGTSATLNGTCNPGGAATTGWFRYSTVHPGAANDSFGTRAPASSGTALGSGSSPVAYSQGISGLIAGTTYYYCAIAQNAEGLAFGTVLSFTTP